MCICICFTPHISVHSDVTCWTCVMTGLTHNSLLQMRHGKYTWLQEKSGWLHYSIQSAITVHACARLRGLSPHLALQLTALRTAKCTFIFWVPCRDSQVWNSVATIGQSHRKDTGKILAHKKTGKAIPVQAWTGPEGSRRLRFTDFKTIDIWWW
jgi:hypothetical protein